MTRSSAATSHIPRRFRVVLSFAKRPAGVVAGASLAGVAGTVEAGASVSGAGVVGAVVAGAGVVGAVVAGAVVAGAAEAGTAVSGAGEAGKAAGAGMTAGVTAAAGVAVGLVSISSMFVISLNKPNSAKKQRQRLSFPKSRCLPPRGEALRLRQKKDGR